MIRRVSLLVVLSTLTTAGVQAQYFGRNKVEYADFEFRVLSSAHFDVYYYAREEAAARLATALAERWYARFAALLDHEFESRQPLVLYGSQPEFAQTNVVSGLLADSVGGVTESARRRIAMPLAPTLSETNRVLGHEIAHAFQFDIGRRHGGAWAQPLWFIEGMAEYLARGPIDDEAGVWLRDAVLTERLPRHERDAARRLSPYQYGHAMWAFLAERYGDEVLVRALKPGKHGKLQDRMRDATGLALETLYEQWRAAMMAKFDDPAPDAVQAATGMSAGRMQLGPALSPDGLQAVFFSERDRLSLDLFLGDVGSGRIVRKLATTTASARFESLQPVRSAGAWSLDGRFFAFAATKQGHAVLVLLDMHQPGSEREIPFRSFGQILALSWSPDGRMLVLSALAGGFTDLYRYDLASEEISQLTSDAFADLHPAWSPDGATIAFATERYTTDLAWFRFGVPQLASLDLATGAVHPIARMDAVSQINPQWAADGRLYFVANSGGIHDVFGLEPDRRTLRQVTGTGAGVTGLTPTSLALSVAGDADVLAYTEYAHGRPQLRIVTGAALQGLVASEVEAVAPAEASPSPVVDPSPDGRPANPHGAGTVVAQAYTPRLSLERIGQPYVSTGGGAFGTFVRAGGALLFGDLLGEHRLGAAMQIGNRLRDAAFEVRYLNQERRWNLGAVVELEPGRRRYRRTAITEHDGEPALLKQVDDLQRVQLAARGVLAYPFSQGLRIEFAGGVRHSAYRRELRSLIASNATGRVLTDTRESLSGGAPTTVAEFGVAVVADTTVFGPTAPLVGTRYRVEVAPAFGQLSYVRALADYRRYLMPVRPFSVAVRLLHSGRYGRDGDDPRLLSTFLGSRYLVRGHGLDSRPCPPDPERVCGDELLGNRLAVANVEIRMPLWGLATRRLEYGPIPADLFVFADGGVVGSPRRANVHPRHTMISSVGAGIRVNAGGLPFELMAVRALDGPAPGWTFDYGFRIGF